MNPSRAKGTLWEGKIVAYLIEQGWPNAERRALNGSQDRGDIAGLPGVCLEAKSSSKAWRLPEWWRELEAERINANAHHGALWVKRVGRTSAAQGWVVMDGETYVRLLKDAGW